MMASLGIFETLGEIGRIGKIGDAQFRDAQFSILPRTRVFYLLTRIPSYLQAPYKDHLSTILSLSIVRVRLKNFSFSKIFPLYSRKYYPFS